MPFLALLVLYSSLFTWVSAQSPPPIVDLGYELHQAAYFNVSLLH